MGEVGGVGVSVTEGRDKEREREGEESDKGGDDGEWGVGGRRGWWWKEKQGQRVETQQRQAKGNDRMLSVQPVGTLKQHACCQPYCTRSPGGEISPHIKHITRPGQ